MTTEQVIRTGQVQPLSRYLNPLSMARNLWSHRELAWQLAKRELLARYREARLGILWSILTPLALLGIYTFVFSVVFQGRWGNDPNESRGEFALTVFCGMLLYNLFAEVVNRAPVMIVANPNYVKRVVFPLEVFVVSGLISGLINMLIGYGVWLAGWMLIIRDLPSWTMVWFPLVLVPVCLTTGGVSWILASLGVFLRDIGHAVGLITQMLFFATPIVYSLQHVPQPFRRVLELNPLTHYIQDARRVLMYGEQPYWGWWAGSAAASVLLAVLGYAFFMKSKRAFADVL